MNFRFTTILLALTLLLVLGVSVTQAAPAERPSEVAPAGIYDFTNHGTAWVAERRAQFRLFRPFGWGIKTKVKTASSQWVHIPIPMPSRIANDFVNVQYVEFCAQSSKGALTKPCRVVAPTAVKRGIGRECVRAAGPVPIMISTRKSSILRETR